LRGFNFCYNVLCPSINFRGDIYKFFFFSFEVVEIGNMTYSEIFSKERRFYIL